MHTTTVKIVKKEAKEKKGKTPSKEAENIAKKMEPENSVFPDLLTIDKEFLLAPYEPLPSAAVYCFPDKKPFGLIGFMFWAVATAESKIRKTRKIWQAYQKRKRTINCPFSF